MSIPRIRNIISYKKSMKLDKTVSFGKMYSNVILLILFGLAISENVSPRVHYKWKYINYTWPSSEAYEQALKDGSYIKEHNVISGVKVWKKKIYLTIPRLKPGVPATLASIPLNRDKDDVSPLLKPYPNWKMQNETDCSALQLVQSMEIDTKGRMWVISNGRIEIRSKNPRTTCPSRLIILDLEKNGEVLLDFAFSEEIAAPNSVYLNDIVLDHEDGGFAYITDNDSENPGIIVFSLRDKASWKISHSTMYPDEEASIVTVNGTSFHNKSPINGIALSPASASERFVYYFPIASFKLFAVPTSVLKNATRDISDHVVIVGSKPSQSGGMVVSASGQLYFGLLGYDAVSCWEINDLPFETNHKVIIMDHARSQYPDSFTIDNGKRLWYTSNRLQAFRTDSVDISRTNFRLIYTETDSKGYQYYENGKAPRTLTIRRHPFVERMMDLIMNLFVSLD